MSANPQDFYTRFMVKAFDERLLQSAPTAFQAIFGRPGNSQTEFVTEAGNVDIDIVRANGRQRAELVHRGQSSADVSRQKDLTDEEFTSITRSFPLIEQEMHFNSAQLLRRQAGENPYSGDRRFDRARKLAIKTHMDQMKRAIRTMEYLASQSILTGTMPAILGTTNDELIYDFKRNAANTITVANAWNSGSQTILADLDDACDLVEQNGESNPNAAFIGGDAMESLILDSEVQAVADNRRFELIQVSLSNPVPPEYGYLVRAGWIPRGSLKTPKGRFLWLFNYNKTWNSGKGTSVNYFMPRDQAFVMDIHARMDRYFGPRDSFDPSLDTIQWVRSTFGFDLTAPPMPMDMVDDLGVVPPQAFYFDAYRGGNGKTATLRSQTAPIFATTQTDAIVVLDGLID